ncbi:MAG: phosphate transport system regulatory protein PhoU, partial [Clostridia bacterium]|nr:phosphate transport system regulatory protein PhoU [Clostridia bacterium]
MSAREGFQNSLVELQKDILRMGSLVEEAIARAVEALKKQDMALAN